MLKIVIFGKVVKIVDRWSSTSGAGTTFAEQGGETGNAKLMRSLSNLDRVFVPEISLL